MFIYDVQRKDNRELGWMHGQLEAVIAALDKMNLEVADVRRENWKVDEPLTKIQREIARQHGNLLALKWEIEREISAR